MTTLDIIHSFYAAQEDGIHGEDLADHWTADVTTTEHPNPINPGGGTIDRSTMIRASSTGAALLAWQRLEIEDELELGDRAVVRLRWSGEIAEERGPFRAGQILRAHVAQFIAVRDGRIASIVTYDCYDAFV